MVRLLARVWHANRLFKMASHNSTFQKGYEKPNVFGVARVDRIPTHARDDDALDDDERARNMTSSLVFGQLKRLHDVSAAEEAV